MAIYSIVTLGLGLLVGRVGMVSLGQGAVLAMGAWVAARLLFATASSVPDRAAGCRADHDGARHAGRPAGAADERPVPGADHADAGGRDHGRARPRSTSPTAATASPATTAASVHIPAIRRPSIATTDPGVLPLLGGRRDPDVPARARPHPRQAGPGVGGDPPERVGGAGGRHQHHVLQAVGVRAGLVRHRRRRRAAWPAASAT